MKFFADKLIEAGEKHDWTKIDGFHEQYGPLCMSRVVDDEFKANPWWDRHVFTERHHVNIDFRDDVTLVDIIEHLVDDTMSGRGRAGHLTSAFMDVDPKLLYLAYWNTIRMLNDAVEISDEIVRGG